MLKLAMADSMENARPMPAEGEFWLAVLNEKGRDPEQAFPDYAGPVDANVHAPVNQHAYAACTRGGFFRSVSAIPEEYGAVLVLLKRDLARCLEVVLELQDRGCAVAVAWKEAGQHQVAAHLQSPKRFRLFREICARSDGALASTPHLVPLYRAAGAKQVAFIPTPYPVEDPRWDFSVPVAHRTGILIGTREWDVPSRNHAAALLLAREFDRPVAVFNEDGGHGKKLIEAAGMSAVRIIDGPLPYMDYLRVLSGFRLVFQQDRSGVPGQVAGDALLCRVPCVGGDGAVDRILFPELPDPARLLDDDAYYDECIEGMLGRAGENLAFSVTAQRLRAFFGALADAKAGAAEE